MPTLKIIPIIGWMKEGLPHHTQHHIDADQEVSPEEIGR